MSLDASGVVHGDATPERSLGMMSRTGHMSVGEMFSASAGVGSAVAA